LFREDYSIIPEDRSAWFHDESDGRPLLTVDENVGESRYAYQIYTAGSYKPPADSHRLYSLIDGARSYGLHFGLLSFSEDTCQCTCYRIGIGFG